MARASDPGSAQSRSARKRSTPTDNKLPMARFGSVRGGFLTGGDEEGVVAWLVGPSPAAIAQQGELRPSWGRITHPRRAFVGPT